MNNISEEEIDREVFLIIRANQESSKKKIIEKIKEHMPKLTNEQLADSLKRLAK